MLCNSILLNDDELAADKTIKYKPGASVLKLKVGDRIALSAAEFALLAAFFAEMEAKFVYISAEICDAVGKQQIPPLRLASVGMTKLSLAVSTPRHTARGTPLQYQMPL
jgi:hypothetical protein